MILQGRHHGFGVVSRLDKALELLASLLLLAGVEERKGSVDQCFVIVRVFFQNLVVEGNGLFVVFQVQVTISNEELVFKRVRVFPQFGEPRKK